jgi:predicted TPR repeat methyltransferase
MDDDTAFERAKALFLEGNAHFAASRFADAAASFEASLRLVPGRASTLANLGATRLRAGRVGDAIPVLEQALEIEPDDLQSRSHLGIAFGAVGRHADALACHDRVLAAEPEHAASWLARGEALRFLGRHDEALAAFERANAIAPSLAAAWTQRGNILRDKGRLDDARHAFEQALLHRGDPELNGYFLAALSGRNVPAQAPVGYVRRFFDEYAASFDAHLVGSLAYRAPQALVGRIIAAGERRFRSALDLGCGTGLCGPLLKPLSERLTGIDLSQRMLDRAAALRVYDALMREEIVAHLRSTNERHDLLVAADVFIYIGALGPVLEGAARVLAPDGLFAFTAEAAGDDSQDAVLLPSLRYAHSERHLRALAAQQGLAVVSLVRAALRREQEREVAGLYVVLRR